jgi:hypothetical protein
MREISFLTEPDRVSWEKLARGKGRYFEVSLSGGDYERARGIATRLDGKTAGIAHYLFHARPGRPQ